MAPSDAQVMDDAIGFEDVTNAGDAAVDVAPEDRPLLRDGGELDGGRTDAEAAADRSPIDAGAADAGAMDVPRADSGALDVPVARDVVDAGDSRTTIDAPTVSDVPPADVLRDVPLADVPRDAPAADVSSCTGAAPVVTVSAPTSGQEIETCSTSGVPVYFDFTASVTASAAVRSVAARWINPDGLEAPPPASLSAAPYVFRRQVGGPSSSGTPALSVFGIRGGWRLEFTATDACGRSTTASQPFSLIYTTRRCPNP